MIQVLPRLLILTLSILILQCCSPAPKEDSWHCTENLNQKLKRDQFGKILPMQGMLADSLPCELSLQLNENDLKLLKALEQYMVKQLPAPQDEWKSCGATDSLISLYQVMLQFPNCHLQELSDYITLLPIPGKDSSRCVMYTGYYTPIISASKTKDSIFNIPVYSKAKKRFFEDTIESDSISYPVVAYLSNYFDRYQLFLQGNSTVRWRNGGSDYLVFDGTNEQPFINLHALLAPLKNKLTLPGKLSDQRAFYRTNQAVIDSIWRRDSFLAFFSLSNQHIKTASGIMPIAHRTVAADKDIYPIGSILLGEVPVLNHKGLLLKYNYQLLYVIDVGGYVRGANHIDLYCGEGKKAILASQLLSHYGRIWTAKIKTL